MTGWVLASLIVIGGMFMLKIVYALSIAVTLPLTQGALFVSTSRPKLGAVFDLLSPAPGSLLIDLGCGDGRILRYASLQYNAKAIGYEVNPLAFCIARLFCGFNNNIDVLWRNFWSADVSKADLIFCYLYPDVMSRLAHKLRAEAKPGAMVISFNFKLPGWTPVRVMQIARARHNDPIYIYKQAAADRHGQKPI